MTLEEIKSLLAEEDKDEKEIIDTLRAKFVNVDVLDNFLTTEDGKKYIQPKMDSYFSKGLESWKGNNLESLIDAEVKKRFPEKDPKDVEIEKIKAELAKMQEQKAREELTNKTIKMVNEKKLPLELVDYVISTDEENTLANLTKLEEIFNSKISEAVEARMKGSNYVPPADDPKKTDYENMSMEEFAKEWAEKNK